MKAHLMFADRDFDPAAPAPPNGADLTADLGLAQLIETMAAKDDSVRAAARTAILQGCDTVEDIQFRQAVLDDCLHNPDIVRSLYALAVEALEGERGVYRGFFNDRPEPLLTRAVKVLELFMEMLRRLRAAADEHRELFRSQGFQVFFTMLQEELDDEYFELVQSHLRRLHFREGVLMSAHLGTGNQAIDFVLLRPHEEHRTFFRRVSMPQPSFSYTVPDRDENGFRALSELRDRALDEVANATTQSADHVLSFFTALRNELGFYIGCLNLHEALTATGIPLCFPNPRAAADELLSGAGLSEVCLALRLAGREEEVMTNDVAADGRSLIMITGANRGGKSTFLRSVGLAQLMMQAGMYVGARQWTASIHPHVFTHFKREEDSTMSSGKLDEELARMSAIAGQVKPPDLLLCNESFASTNEQEGSDIGHEIVLAMVGMGVTVCYVTHLYDLAHRLFVEDSTTSLFLRAERADGGARTFAVTEGKPLATSYGRDLYDQIFSRLPESHATSASADGR